MKCQNRGCIVFLLAGVLGLTAGTARAEDPGPEPAAPKAPAERRFTGDKQSFYISGNASDSPFWTIGTTFPNGVVIAVGLDINYDGNGLVDPTTGKPGTDKFGFNGLLYGAYYFYNKFPVGILAEAALVAPLSPKQFDPLYIVQPGIGFYYAPFPAPLVLGTALDLAITKPKIGSVSVKTVTPGVRITYVF